MTATHKTRYCRCGAPLARDNRGPRCAACAAADRNRLVTAPDVSPEFWKEPVLHEALLNRHLGTVVRAWRTHPDHGRRPIPQDQMAAWLGITQAQLSRIENGPPMMHLDRLIHWARVLHIPAEQLWFAMPDTTWPLEDDDAESPATVQVIPRQEVQQETRTHPASLHEEIVMSAEESARFVRRAGVTVTPEVLEQLDTDVKWLATEYLRRPPYAVFRPLAALRRDVFDMIDRHPRPGHVADLYRVAGQLSALLAHASNDLGQPYAADSHARTAWLCADLAGDNTTRAYIRWVQSHVAYWRGEYLDAAELARSGQRLAGEVSDLLRLSSQEARALAAARDEREANRALAVAGDARERVADGARPVGVFYFAPGKAAYYASEVRLSLGGEANFRLSATAAEEALELFAAAPEREQSAEFIAAAQLDLIAAQLALNDLDGADAHAQTVLQLPSENRTVPIIGRMAKINQTLADEAFENVALASDLREQITLFCAYPATRELPQPPAS